MKILGLDPSIRNFGMCLIDENENILWRECFVPVENYPPWFCISKVLERVIYTLDVFKPDYVAIEYPLVRTSHGALIYALYCQLVKLMTDKQIIWKAFFPTSCRLFTNNSNTDTAFKLQKKDLSAQTPKLKSMVIHEFDAYLYACLLLAYLDGHSKLKKTYAKYDKDLEYSNLGFYGEEDGIDG